MLSAEEIARVRAEHRLADVLGRAGVSPPGGWTSRNAMVSCPLPDHDDTTPSMSVHPETDRYHCFGCGAHGDVLQLVRDLEGITSLTLAAEVLDSRRALRSFPSSRTRDLTSRSPGVASTAVTSSGVEQPDHCRTGAERVLEVNAAAWDYLTTPNLAERARRYLRGRGIDVRALESETGRPLAGHSPSSVTGLGDHLLREGFTAHELVDAGWISTRPDTRATDRYRGRVLLPARDDNDQVLGVYARDVTARSNAKYLNSPDTVIFKKGRVLYRPTTGNVTSDTTVVVCEGPLDALAIAATAADAGRAASFAPVAPSGTALTSDQVRVLLRLSDAPPVLCADGDDAGMRATATWASAIIAEGRECLATVLPDGADPAEWLARHGVDGLGAFCSPSDRQGHNAGAVRPHSPGALLATATCAELRTAGYREDAVAKLAVRRLGALSRSLPNAGVRRRFALDANRALAAEHLGAAREIGTKVFDAIAAPYRAGSDALSKTVCKEELAL